VSRDPFKPTTDQSTEMGWGPGHFPDPAVDFSNGGQKSGFPIGDPDRRSQYLDLFTARRTDLNRTDVPDAPAFQGTVGSHPDYYTEGNTERYGANPALVRARGRPPKPKVKYAPRAHMEREF
jgi:hypothetical protein